MQTLSRSHTIQLAACPSGRIRSHHPQRLYMMRPFTATADTPRRSLFPTAGRPRRAAFDRHPAAIIELREPSQKLGQIGRTAAKFDYGRLAGANIAHGVAGMHVNTCGPSTSTASRGE